jgi:hypothetical protein
MKKQNGVSGGGSVYVRYGINFPSIPTAILVLYDEEPTRSDEYAPDKSPAAQAHPYTRSIFALESVHLHLSSSQQ